MYTYRFIYEVIMVEVEANNEGHARSKLKEIIADIEVKHRMFLPDERFWEVIE